MIINLLQTTNLAARLVVELCALSAVSYWGFHIDRSTGMRIVAGIGAPLAVALVWALFASPNTEIVESGPVKASIQLVVFAVAAGALIGAGRTRLAVAFATFAAINAGLMTFWSQ